ncbi:MAG: VWA domain-containing protein [Alphaproteobacteria bacterium]|nr:VWA domain-containing protein [Alphaproteobacteria bacterium]
MEQIFENFHFLRPQWLWALVPVAILTALFWNSRIRSVGNGWARYIDPHLLTHLSVSGGQQQHRRIIPVVSFSVAALIVLGLAGPSWQKTEVPSFTGGEPVVAVLSLAQSMNANDLTPSRLQRSVHKLRDILARTEGDERGLVIYSDVPFVAAPLTNDLRVIEQMLPELSTSLMPVLGNRLDLAIDEATDVLARADARRGQIIVIADNAGTDPAASLAAARAARDAGYELSVLAVGTETGATLQTADGRAISTQDGQTFMTRLSKDNLMELTKAGGGRFSMITPGDADLASLLPTTQQEMHAAGKSNDFNTDGWVDMGYWLLIIPALLAPLLFRRGMIMGLVLLTGGLLAQPQPAAAQEWTDLWSTKDQQAQEAFRNGDFASAATTFETPDWQAGSAYRAGDFETAIAAYSQVNAPDTDYNLGNAFAWSGDLEASLAAYDRALEAHPNDEDAQFNRDLIAKLLEQQKQDEQQSEDQQQDSSQQDNNQQDSQDRQQQGSDSEQSQQQNQGDQQEQQQQAGDASDEDPSSEQGSQEQQQAQDQSGSSGSDQASENSGDEPSEGSKASEGEQHSQSADQDGNQATSDGEAGQQERNADSSEKDTTGSDQQEQTAQSRHSDPNASDRNGDARSPQQPTAQQGEVGEQQMTGEADSQSQREDQSGESPLSRLLSKALEGNGEPQQQEVAASAGPAPVNQAVEQQLRRVPDDPSGLLRARIHQHYARMNATQ